MPLSSFHPAVARWFERALGTPTSPQAAGWAAIRAGRHTLIAAPTGSGKTLAAFLIAIDDLFREAIATGIPDQTRVIYVSPLKALSSDIHKNLSEPLDGVRAVASEMGIAAPRITSAVRTGDTTSSSRAAMLRTPPHILVTTPESLYLLLTSEGSRDRLKHVRTVIVDEIHAVIGTRRGAHLALSLERLAAVTPHPLQRIGLSATQRPVEAVARFLVGTPAVHDGVADCAVIDEGHRRDIDLAIELPGSPLEAVMAHEVWSEYYDRIAALIQGHRTTLVFVNTRKMAERLARQLADRLGEDRVAAHHGSLSKERRLDAEQRLKSGAVRAVVATASLELGIDIGHVDLVCQIGSPRRIATLLQRVGRAGHTIHGTPKGRIFPETRDDLVECAALMIAVRRGELDRLVMFDGPLDVLAQQIVAEASCRDWQEDDLYALARRAWPYRDLSREDFDAVIGMLADGFTTRRGRRGGLIHRDEVHRRVVAKRAARMTALTSGGAIPDVADYRVVLDPDETFLGTLNEDFAIESNAGDIFQLGNSSWRILQVAGGIVRVADAHGAPPTIPFWLGEAPGRSVELSSLVSDLRAGVEASLAAGPDAAIEWLIREAGVARDAAVQIVDYLGETHRILGALPTSDTIILERFFDDSGGMQLVLHAPFGSRVNRAWALALRKRFCRQFNFELQAAATEEGLLLSLSDQHAFPLADVFRYLHPSTVRDILVQAFLDAPVFQTRWRWNATVSLAVSRMNGGVRVPAPLQRMRADDLLASAFPDAAACLENIPGDRQIPDHPLVSQTVRDCLEEAMDLPRLESILERIHAGNIRCLARDTTEPSPLSHEILNARPYAFLDDAPLEERRAHAVQTRRSSDDKDTIALGVLDGSAIAMVREEAQPDPRDEDELHDTLVTIGFLTDAEVHRNSEWQPLFDALAASGRAAHAASSTWPSGVWVAAERLPELIVVESGVQLHPPIEPPPHRAAVAWTKETAAVELLRGRLGVLGPITPRALGEPLGLSADESLAVLLSLETEGVVLRGWFSPAGVEEWCDRRLLARIHRATLQRLRAEIQPVSQADFMRFLFEWQHLSPSSRVSGVEGVRKVITQLDGFELAADAWDTHVLPARVSGYDGSMLDLLCYGGEAAWARITPPPPAPSSALLPSRPVRATPVALFVRDHGRAWRALASPHDSAKVSDTGVAVLRVLERGAQFAHEIAAAMGATIHDVREALGELVWAGLVASDGFAGLRSTWAPSSQGRSTGSGGRWARLDEEPASPEPWRRRDDRDAALELYARTLLNRYGIVCRRLLTREPFPIAWRELLRVYRRLEARGEIRGGRFVTGVSGEQFALPEAVAMAREVRRRKSSGEVVTISAADPLNLCGILDGGDRIPAVASTSIVFRDGIHLPAIIEENVADAAHSA